MVIFSELSIARNSIIGPNSSNSATASTRKNLHDVKVRYSPITKAYNKYNNVFVKEFKFGLLSLKSKNSTDTYKDAYISSQGPCQ
jgi:ABC-type sulfate transport system substrate-binding protein